MSTTAAVRLHVTTGSFISADCAVTAGGRGGERDHANAMQIRLEPNSKYAP